MAAPPAPAPEAVALFERAMNALQHHRYEEGAGLFRRLVADFSGERALVDRARVYADLCTRECSKKPAKPVTIEERVTSATAALNNGDEGEAERLANSVLHDHPDHDLALYIVAAVHARRGETESALEWLGRAMEASPDVRAQARHDADFESLKSLEGFQQLLDAPHSAQSGTRHLRKLRSER